MAASTRTASAGSANAWNQQGEERQLKDPAGKLAGPLRRRPGHPAGVRPDRRAAQWPAGASGGGGVTSPSEADHVTSAGGASPDPPVAAAPAEAAPDPVTLLRSRDYLSLLILAAVIGLPISAIAYFFLVLVAHLQGW